MEPGFEHKQPDPAALPQPPTQAALPLPVISMGLKVTAIECSLWGDGPHPSPCPPPQFSNGDISMLKRRRSGRRKKKKKALHPSSLGLFIWPVTFHSHPSNLPFHWATFSNWMHLGRNSSPYWPWSVLCLFFSSFMKNTRGAPISLRWRCLVKFPSRSASPPETLLPWRCVELTYLLVGQPACSWPWPGGLGWLCSGHGSPS